MQRVQQMRRSRTGTTARDGFRIPLFRTWHMKLEQKCPPPKRTVFVVRTQTLGLTKMCHSRLRRNAINGAVNRQHP